MAKRRNYIVSPRRIVRIVDFHLTEFVMRKIVVDGLLMKCKTGGHKNMTTNNKRLATIHRPE